MAAGKHWSESDQAAQRLRSIVCRRNFLQVGALSVGTSAVRPLLGSDAIEPVSSSVDSVVMLWMGGGVTHIDSLDPKPEAPEEVRGTLSAIATRTPGVFFNETCPQLASISDKISVLRSFSHDSNDHFMSQAYTLSGRKVTREQITTEPNVGSIVSYLKGPRNSLPGYIAVPGLTQPGPPPTNLFVGGWLGRQYAPFAVGGKRTGPYFASVKQESNPAAEFDEDLRCRELVMPEEVPVGRLSRRASLRVQLNESARNAERLAAGDVEGHYRNALDLLMSPRISDAFDIGKESEETREEYGRTKIGGRCLMARRLVEAGARFVMVDYGYDPEYGNLWDNHNVAVQNFPHSSELAKRGYHVAGIDRAFAALVDDLHRRGRLERTLVVFLTEFGRTPKINANGGRDHWGACGSLFFAGGGVRGGRVVGQSDEQGAFPITDAYGPADVAATMLTSLGISPDTRVKDVLGRPVPALDHGSLIQELF